MLDFKGVGVRAESGPENATVVVVVVFFGDGDVEVSHFLVEDGKESKVESRKIDVLNSSISFGLVSLWQVVLILPLSQKYLFKRQSAFQNANLLDFSNLGHEILAFDGCAFRALLDDAGIKVTPSAFLHRGCDTAHTFLEISGTAQLFVFEPTKPRGLMQ